MATYAGRYDEPLLRSVAGQLQPVPEAVVTVYQSDGSTLATLYTGRTKASTAANPMSPDAQGNLEFFAEPGTYVLSIAVDGTVVRSDTVVVSTDPAEPVEGLSTAATDTSLVLKPDGSGGLAFGSGASSLALIAETELTADAASVDFTAIPATYRHLMVVASLRTSRASGTAETVAVALNGDTTDANYRRQALRAYGTTVAADEKDAVAGARDIATVPQATSPAGRFGLLQFVIPNYTEAIAKAVRSFGFRAFATGAAGAAIDDFAVQWATTSAVTQVTIAPTQGGLFVAGTAVSLYGIKGA